MNANVVKALALGIVIGIYLLSPLDLLPDVAPPFTWVDDGGVLYLGGKKIMSWLSDKPAEKAAA